MVAVINLCYALGWQTTAVLFSVVTFFWEVEFYVLFFREYYEESVWQNGSYVRSSELSRSLQEPGISSAVLPFMFLVAVDFWSLALSGSWVEGEEPDSKAVNPYSSRTSQEFECWEKVEFQVKTTWAIMCGFPLPLTGLQVPEYLPVCAPQASYTRVTLSWLPEGRAVHQSQAGPQLR